MLCLVCFKKETSTPEAQVEEKTMKNPKRLATAVVLTLVLGLSAFAGETSAPPCAAPEPGETSSPPCTGQMASDNSGLVSTPSASDYLVAEAARSLVESLLPLF
jgi:hypothetical protein